MNVIESINRVPELNLEEYFRGKTTAYGMFESRSGTIKNQFKVVIRGQYDGSTLTLDEDFYYQSGETDQRTWTIKNLGDGRYEGSTDGVVGTAHGQVSGNEFKWQYLFDLPVGDKKYRLKFDDRMLLQQDGVLLNRARVSKWGFTVGSVTLSFQKTDNEKTSPTLPFYQSA